MPDIADPQGLWHAQSPSVNHDSFAEVDLSNGSGSQGLVNLANSANSANSSYLKEMLEAKSSLESSSPGDDEDRILNDTSLDSSQKSQLLQKLFFVAASNGNTDTVKQLLNEEAKEFIDINAKDSNGSTALIYASCFGHESIVLELLRSGSKVDEQDKCEYENEIEVALLT